MRLALTLAAALALCAGCSNESSETSAEPTTLETTTEPTTTEPETTTSATPPPTPPPAPVRERSYQLWFAQGDANLELFWQRAPAAEGAVAAALQLLLANERYAAQPFHLDSWIPARTRLLGVDLDDGVATVDLSSEFGASAPRRELAFRAAQVVYTATQFPTVRRVQLRVEGAPYPAPAARGQRMLERPLTRRDYEALLPAIVVESPAWGETVSSPLTVSGSANVFEANVTLRVLDARRRELATTFTTATCGTGCRGTFRGAIRFPAATTRRGYVVAQDDDADGDGFPSHSVTIPVRFRP